jgi:cell division septation protein DedD
LLTIQNKIEQAISVQWLVRITAYKDITAANDLLGRLESNYPVWIKEFKKSGTYSVRTGPYLSKAKAEQDKRKLDKMLRTNAEVVQLN